MGLAQDKFNVLDANHDGVVDRQEAAQSNSLKAMFAKVDSDHDGKLSLAEFSAINDLAAIKQDKNGAVRKLQ
jgi:Ca2+-binding EF-hand superfamily protein